MASWLSGSSDFYPLPISGLNLDLIMTEPNPKTWSVSLRYPASGTTVAHYFFRGFYSLNSSVAGSDQSIVPSTEGSQDIVIPFYTHEHRFSVQMVSGDEEKGLADSFGDLAFYRGERFLRSIRNNTEDGDENWELIFRFTDYTEVITQNPRLILSGAADTTAKETVYRMVGKIMNASMSVQPIENSRRVQIDFTFAEDTEL